MSVRYWSIVCLFFLSGAVSAQSFTLTARVVDKATGDALEGAYAVLPTQKKYQLSEANGLLRFDSLPAGTYRLEVSYVGKKALITDVTVPGVVLPIELEDDENILNEVVVKNQKEEGFSLTRLHAIEGVSIYEGKKTEVISIQELSANLAANNPRQIYGRVAGLNIWESDGAGLQLGIGGRGLSPNRTANFNTRQNGYDISADALGYPESYYTPPTEALERIEVVRGAASLQYGTQFGGMLNFRLRQPPEGTKAFLLRTRQTVGSFGFFSTYNELSGTTAHGKLSYLGFLQYKRGDGWRENSGFNVTNGYLDIHWHPSERWEVGVEVTRMHYLAQQPGGLTDVFFERDPQASYRSRNWFQVGWNLLTLHSDYKISDRTRWNTRSFGLSAYRQSLGNLAPINVIDLGGNRDLIDGQFQNLGHESRLLHRYSLGGRDQFFVAGVRLYHGYTTARQGEANDGSGADFAFLNPSNIEKSDYSFPNQNYAAFVEHIFYLNDHWSVTPGIRYEYIDTKSDGYYKQRVFDAAGNLIAETRQAETQNRNRQFLLGGLGISYKPDDKFEWYGNFSQNYRAINFSDLRIDNPNGRVDANIQDEHGYTADLGWRVRRTQHWYADVTAFYIAYRNRIGQVLRSGEAPLYNDYRYRTNIGDSRNLGVEAFTEANLWHWIKPGDTIQRLNLFVNASWVDARYTRSDDKSIEGRQVELVPPLTIRTGLTYQRKAWKTAFTWAYTAQHYTDATNSIRTATAVNGIIPAYTVADASISYRWKQLTFEASCNNLFNAAYFTRRADAYPGPGIIPSDGRGWYVTVGYEMK